MLIAALPQKYERERVELALRWRHGLHVCFLPGRDCSVSVERVRASSPADVIVKPANIFHPSVSRSSYQSTRQASLSWLRWLFHVSLLQKTHPERAGFLLHLSLSVSLLCPRLGSTEKAVIVNEHHPQVEEIESTVGCEHASKDQGCTIRAKSELRRSIYPTNASSLSYESSSNFPLLTLFLLLQQVMRAFFSLAMGSSRAHPRELLKLPLKLHLLVFTKLKGCPLFVLRLRLQSRQAIQSVLRPNRPVPRSRRALLTLRHENLPRSCTQHILEHKIRYVGGWLRVDAVLVEFPNICFPAEDAGLMPRWVDNGCADTVTIGIAVTQLRTKA